MNVKMNSESSTQNSDQVFNVPNQISAARLVLAFVFFVLLPLKFYWAAFAVFVVAASTDWVDGWYARKYNMVTKLGRVLDPFCDKILICGAYILLAVEMESGFDWYGRIAGWMAVVVVGRELLVTVLRSMIEGGGGSHDGEGHFDRPVAIPELAIAGSREQSCQGVGHVEAFGSEAQALV